LTSLPLGALTALCLQAVWALDARAEPGPDARSAVEVPQAQQQANQEAERAFVLYQGGDVDGACRLFERSVQRWPLPVGLLNAGICRQHRGELAAAHQAFVDGVAAVNLGVADPTERAGYIQDFQVRLTELEVQLGTLSVRAPPGSAIGVDGQRVRDLGEPLWLAPGEHRLQATAADGPDYEHVVWIEAGKHLEVDLGAAPAPVSASPASVGEPLGDPASAVGAPAAGAGPLRPAVPQQTQVQVSDHWTRATEGRFGVLPWVLMGSGAGLVLTSLFTGRVSSNALGALESHCGGERDPMTGKRPCAADLADELKRVDDFALATDVLWVSGAVLAGAGVTLWWLDWADAGESTKLDARCVVGGCSLSATGRF
jgi:hypothetical protein